MQLIATRKLFLGIFIMLCCGFVFKTSAQQGESSHPANKDVIIKGPAVSTKDTSEDGIIIIAKDSAIALPLMSPAPVVPNITAGKYYKANLLHYKMIDSLVRVISEFPLQDSAGLKYSVDWVGTPNMGLRRPNYVIIHYTATNGFEEVIQEFTNPVGREASSHYLICKDGTVYHMLNDLLRSHHAGDSKWGNNTDLNSSSIGIEIVNNGKQPYTDEQISSLTILLDRLKTQYRIPDANFIGHGDIAPTRKADPGNQFPWEALSEKGFGLWWDDTTNVVVPINFDGMMALRIIGYDISSPASAISAFRRHFMQDSKSVLTPDAIKILYTLYRKFE
jgi:N-acetylmuramoyl-L-alanine amidase